MRHIAFAAVLAAGCGLESVGGDPEPVADGEIEIRSPEPASFYYRETIDAYGALVANVPFDIGAGSPITSVVLRDQNDLEIAELSGPSFSGDIDIPSSGNLTITATGYDELGEQVAATSVNIYALDPEVADCYGWLDMYGLQYERGPDRQGVDDPVTVTTPINGVAHRSLGSAQTRETFFMDCNLAVALAAAAPVLRRRDVVEVADLGVYNYRCIGGGEPPNCPNGVSWHAYAKAIDIAGYTTGDGSFYSVNDDWVIDGENEATCGAATEGEKDEFLHEIICAQKAAGVWNIVLTPNYNAAHRNHFHVDLTTGSNFLRASFPVDAGPDLH